MKTSSIFWLHIGYWFVYLLIWLVVLAAINEGFAGTDDSFSYPGLILGVAITPAVYTFYIYYYILFPAFFRKGLYVKGILIGILVSLSSFLIAALTLWFSADMALSCYSQSNYIAIFIVSFISFLNGGVAFIIRGFVSWLNDNKINEELLKQNHKMELALVKAQLDPHFLFNTLNNIDILILKDAQTASAYLKKLSDILRFMLFETKAKNILLSNELNYIRKYVELQKIRSSNKAYISYTEMGDAMDKSIAPFVFIPFIENAFKHTVNKKLENAIQIRFDITDDYVYMHCENRKAISAKSEIERNGMGNDLIVKRLKLLYPDSHHLEIENYGQKYIVKLKIHYEKV